MDNGIRDGIKSKDEDFPSSCEVPSKENYEGVLIYCVHICDIVILILHMIHACI